MKKILVILLIFLLAIGSFSCGGKDGDKTQTPDGANAIGESEEGGSTAGVDEDAAYDEQVKEDDDDIDEKDYVPKADESEKAFDLGFSVKQSFGLSQAVDELESADLESLKDKLESNLAAAIKACFGSANYPTQCEYEEGEIDDDSKNSMKDLVYAQALEDDDADKKLLEAGKYGIEGDAFRQYVNICSETYDKASDETISELVKLAQESMGVSIAKARLRKAAEIVMKNADKTDEEFYSLYSAKTIKDSGKGYSEEIRVTVDGFINEDGSSCFYLFIERDRQYK